MEEGEGGGANVSQWKEVSARRGSFQDRRIDVELRDSTFIFPDRAQGPSSYSLECSSRHLYINIKQYSTKSAADFMKNVGMLFKRLRGMRILREYAK